MSDYRRIRIPGAIYFFTVVTADREPVLTRDATRVALRASVQAVRREHPFAVKAWVLLPDHLHCLWRLPEGDADYSIRWAKIKRHTRHRLGVSPNEALWQPRYWDHWIRDEEDYARHVDYIHWNPVKHGLVRRTVEWPYSTFHRFVASGRYPREWGMADVDFPHQDFGE